MQCTSVITILQCNPPGTLNALHRAMYLTDHYFAMQSPGTLQHVARDSFLINMQLATAVRDRLQMQQPHFSHIHFKMGTFIGVPSQSVSQSVRMELDSSDTAAQSVCCSSSHELCNSIFMTHCTLFVSHPLAYSRCGDALRVDRTEVRFSVGAKYFFLQNSEIDLEAHPTAY